MWIRRNGRHQYDGNVIACPHLGHYRLLEWEPLVAVMTQMSRKQMPLTPMINITVNLHRSGGGEYNKSQPSLQNPRRKGRKKIQVFERIRIGLNSAGLDSVNI